MRLNRLLSLFVFASLIASMVFAHVPNNTRAAPFTITVQGSVFNATGVPAPIGTDVNITIYDGAVLNGVYQAKVLDSFGFYYNDSVSADNGFIISVNASFDSFFDYSNDTVMAGDANYVIHLGQVIYGASISAPADDEGLPGTTITYMFTVENEGNVKDKYDLSILSQSGWPVSIIDSYQTGILMPGESVFVNVSVTIPAEELAHDTDTITLRAESVLDPGNAGTATATTTVLLSPGVEVIPSPTASGYPGDAVTMMFQVKNLGNGQDSFHLTASIDDPGWQFNMEPASDTALLASNKRAYINITVQVPVDSLYNDYALVNLRAESNADSSVSDEEDQMISTLHAAGLELTGPDSAIKGHPGGIAQATLSLKNTGNGPDTFTFIVSATPDWDLDMATGTLAGVRYGEARNFTVDLIIPTSASIGEEVEIEVTASSASDASKTDSVTYIIQVVANREPVAVISSPENGANYTTNDTIVFNGSASHDPEHDELVFNWTSSIDGNLGTSAEFTAKLTAGTHIITLTVDDGFGGRDQKTVTITVTVPDDSGTPGGDSPNNIYFLLLAIIIITIIVFFIGSRFRKKPETDGDYVEPSGDEAEREKWRRKRNAAGE